MQLILTLVSTTLLHFVSSTRGQLQAKVVLTNDDGWAEANIRAAFDSLTEAKYDVVLSAPAENQSGTGFLDLPPSPRTSPCEFDSCPANSPPQGFNASNPRLNYVNSFPVTSVKYGIQTLAPQFFSGSPPDIVISGPNAGGNTGLEVFFSGTVGAASEAIKEGIPAIAFSGATDTQRSFTDIVPGDFSTIYAELATKLTNTIVGSGQPFLPPNTGLNVNFPEAGGNSSCKTSDQFSFVLSRIFPRVPIISGNDVETCGKDTLPTEGDVLGASGRCLVSISVFNPHTKLDSDAATQGVVLQKLGNLLTCL